MSYIFTRSKKLKYISLALSILAFFITFFGVGIYYLGWRSRGIAFISRFIPYPAILVDWEAVPFSTYGDDLLALEKYWDFQRENKNVLLGIPDYFEIRENLVNKLINEKIISIYARKNGISVTDEEKYLEWEQLKAKPGNDQEIGQFLGQAYGWSDDKFISRVLEPFLLREKIKAALIENAKKQDSDLEKEAQKIYAAATEENADFSSLAREYSEDEFSAKNGGDLGYFGRGAMDPYFEEAVFSMQIGEISKPVKSSFGYHIIKLEDLLYDDSDIPTQARARHILIKGFDFNKWLEEQKQNTSVFRMVL